MINLSEHNKGTIAVFAAAILWSTGGIFIKLIEFNSFQICFFRSLLSAIVFCVLFGKKSLKLNKLSLFNALMYSGILILFVTATKLTTAANAIFLQYTAPFYVLILEPLLLKTKFNKINIITIVLSFIGMSLFFAGDLEVGHLTGNVLALLSGVAFAVFLLGMRKNDSEFQANSIFLGNILIVLFCTPSMFTMENVTLSNMLMVTYLGIFQIGIAYAIFSYGLKRVLAIEASLFSMIEPVLNPVWVYFGYGEVPTIYAIIGGIIIIFALIIKIYKADFSRS